MNTNSSSPSDSVLLTLWQADNNQSWVLLTSSSGRAPVMDPMLGFHGLGFAQQSGGGFNYAIDPRWVAHARMHQQSWLGATSMGSCLSADVNARRAHCNDGGLLTPNLLESEIGATFKGAGYSLGMGVRATRPLASESLLPRVVPNAPLVTNVNGLPFTALENSTSVHASGRLALGDRTGIDMGASVGRIRLLPGNLLGIDTLGQKSLSFGMDSGPVSGRIIGRIIQPESGIDANILGPDHSWTSIDLGITWKLPWQGSLSFGTQNLWTSGSAPTPKDGPKPDQSRIPFVQYHQDF
ncbi:MAG TPA: hypothetical protein VF269_03030 [Rhodanobacteraceae bacterium]